MGIANVIPGVSGGTIAVTFNIFDRLIGIISKFRSKIKQEWPFLLQLFAGMGLSILLFSKLVHYLITYHFVLTNFFFMGVVLGSIPLIWRKSTTPSFKPITVLPFLLCLGIMIASVVLMPEKTAEVATALSPMVVVKMLFYGIIGSACMLIPGISGSFVLMFIGGYSTVIGAVSGFNIPVLIPLGIGIIIGVVGCAKIIDALMKRYARYTYMAILGFVVGSIFAIYPGYQLTVDGIWPFFTLLLGFGITLWSNWERKPKRKNEVKQKIV